MNLLNLKWQDANNAGDSCCSPCLYFPKFMGADIVHMNHWRGMDLTRYDSILIGGGGLLNEENLPTIQDIAAQHRKVILWAVGTNSAAPAFDIPSDFGVNVKGWLRHEHPKFGIGSCPSCMHPALREDTTMIGEKCFVSHKDRLLSPEAGCRHATNSDDPQSLIQFIKGHRHIVTNTYHAAYWAWLLGKQVEIVQPWSTKFTGCVAAWESIGRLQSHMELARSMYETALTWIHS